MGKGLMKVMAPHIKNILWGSRSPENATVLLKDLGYEGQSGTYEETLTADVIIHTMWFRDLLPWAKENAEQLKGKILVDIANPFTADFSDFTTDWRTSAAEELQRVVPGTKVVGAFKNTFWKVFDQPIHHGIKSDVYITSDDEEAKHVVIDLLQPLPFRIMDAGILKHNRTIERMTLFSRELSQRYGHYPYVSWTLWGGDDL